MQVLELMKQRCSIRKFEDRPIEKEKLLYVLEAARGRRWRVTTSPGNCSWWKTRT